MSSDDRDLVQSVEAVLAANTLMQAQFEVLRDLVFQVAAELGVSSIDGLPLPSWFQREKTERVDRILMQFEDRNPEIAAWLQQLVDARRDMNPPPQAEG